MGGKSASFGETPVSKRALRRVGLAVHGGARKLSNAHARFTRAFFAVQRRGWWMLGEGGIHGFDLVLMAFNSHTKNKI